MTLSMNEIRARCARFSDQWKDASDEHAEAKSFWDALFEAFGANRRQLARYEHPVKLPSGSTKFIDVLWKTKLLVEQKSRGKNLDDARSQGQDYIPYLPADARPRYLVVSDFARFDVEDLHTGERHQFRLEELADNAAVLGFLGGYQPRRPSIEAPVNIQAVELLGDLHDALKEGNYPPHDLERLLVRILFCFFAEDTGLFDPDEFSDYIVNRTREDGSDLGSQLEQFFTVLDTPKDERQKHLDEALVGLPYVNGNVFSGRLAVAAMNKVMHEALLRCVDFDWSKVHPGIFGSLFQGVMDTKERRAVGAHYTSEENILRLINPLFMDSLRTELAAIKNDRSNRRVARLDEFHRKLADLRFLDPACGCGNFLVIAYREVRRLEIEVLKEVYGEAQQITDIALLSRVSVTSFYGIEIGEFACAIAKVAMWFMEHIMNTELSFAFGRYFVSLPLVHSAQIVHANSLRTDWKELLPPSDHVVVFGNPPFVGARYQTDGQREDVQIASSKIAYNGVLDYVTGWYFKAADYIAGTKAQCAFVSTNSITQGEQVAVLWPTLLQAGIRINFAHRTFAWESEARGKAHVHVVIIGFGMCDLPTKTIFEHKKTTTLARQVKQINPYLVDGPYVTVSSRSKPICDVPQMFSGNQPVDGGGYFFTPDEKRAFLDLEPNAAKFFRRSHLPTAMKRYGQLMLAPCACSAQPARGAGKSACARPPSAAAAAAAASGEKKSASTASPSKRSLPRGSPADAKTSAVKREGTHTASMASSRGSQPDGSRSVSNMVRATRAAQPAGGGHTAAAYARGSAGGNCHAPGSEWHTHTAPAGAPRAPARSTSSSAAASGAGRPRAYAASTESPCCAPDSDSPGNDAAPTANDRASLE
jgi:hypothetical protein